MYKTLVLFIAAFALSGCASSSTTTDRLDAIERQLSSLQRTADQALETAREARSAAAGATDAASEAQRQARLALDAANEASERARRIDDECCGRK